MNIIGMLGSNEQFGIIESLREESASGQRAGLLSAYTGGAREKTSARQSGASDSVFISETAMLLASGMLAPGADEAAPLQDDSRDSLGLYSSSSYSAFAQARLAARLARSEAAVASMALLAPLPPGGDDSKGPDGAVISESGASSSSDAAFTVARLQNRLRDLQQELAALEGGDTPDPAKVAEAHSLTSQINRARQDISGLAHRTRR